jgi:hypothetical protein
MSKRIRELIKLILDTRPACPWCNFHGVTTAEKKTIEKFIAAAIREKLERT